MTFDRDGYIICRDWFNAEELKDFAEAAERVTGSNGERYDALWLTPQFLRLASSKRTQVAANQLLERDIFDPLYLYNSRCLIQPPNDDSHCWDWHQEVFHAIPETKFLQVWGPLVRDSSVQNGTIEVLPGSHREGIARQSWTNEGTGYALVAREVVAEYSPLVIPMKLGDLMFFDPRLIHRSGKNTSSETRYALVGCYTTLDAGFKAPKPVFEFRGKTPQGWLSEHFR